MAQRKVNCEVYTDRGIVGKDGKSAYQQAVEGGYQGTEEEFEQALASDIATVADNVTNINAVGNNIENVNTVAGNATNINTVATNISSINTAATNMPAIIAAPTEAANAANSATEASASATIATTQAELAKGYADSIDLSNYRTSADQDIIDATLATKAELAGYLPLASKAVANGVASLDANAKVPSEQIPVAAASALGGVKPDGETITVTEDGTISVPVSAELATKAELQAVDSSKVSKAGDTMTGPLKMSGVSEIRFGTDDNYYYIEKNVYGDLEIYNNGKGLYLQAAEPHEPYYWNGTNPLRLLTTADLSSSSIGENLAPDYSAAVTIPNNAVYTAPANGWIMGYASQGDWSSYSLIVNNTTFLYGGRKSYNTGGALCFFIGKGQTVQPRADAILRFVPCIGA